MDKEKLKGIPNLPGTYLMKDKTGRVLYIGKAASLKKRVSSYFMRDSNLSHRINLMVEQVRDISFFVTGSEAEALISESALIKKYRPRYNVVLKDDKSYPCLKLTVNEDFPRLFLTRKRRNLPTGAGAKADDGALYYGPYTDVKLLRKALKIMKRIFPLRTCARIPKKPCLDYHIGQCYAPCIQAIDKKAYAGIVKELKLFLSGRREKLIDELSKKMRKAAARKDYERAAILRDRITALSVIPRVIGKPYDEIIALMHLLGMKRAPRRIEAYDISNISGSEAVGSMISFVNGRPSKDDYRRFRIRGVKGIDDCKMMKEIIRRRYERVKKERLPSPDLIIIDGGKGQLNIARSILRELGFERIPVIGIAKKFEHIYLKERKEPIIFSRGSPVLHLIQRLRNEAHRFAIGYHRKLRGKRLTVSVLDGIEGIGEKKKKILLNRLGSLENIRNAGLGRLTSLKGIDIKTAKRIRNAFSSYAKASEDRQVE